MTRTQKFVGAGVAVVLVIVVATFLYLQDDAPPAPSIGEAAAAAGEETTAEDTAGDDAAAGADTAGEDTAGEDTAAEGRGYGDGASESAEPNEDTTEQPAGETAAVGDVAGTWSVDDGNPDDIDVGTFAGYRVEEELRGIGQTTAFGRSPEVTGEVVLTEDTVESVEVTADLTALESDSGNRDNAIRTRGLETNEFPEATFTSTAPVELPDGATDGEAFTVEVPGELTLHGVTNEVTVPLEAQLVGDRIAVVSSFLIDMTDYDITPPQVGPVLSIADEGTMELQLFLSRA